MAKVFDFLDATNDALREHGVELPLPGQSTTTPDTRFDRGIAQVGGHVRGHLNVGNTHETLLNVLTQLIPHIGYPRTLNALRVLDEITLKQN